MIKKLLFLALAFPVIAHSQTSWEILNPRPTYNYGRDIAFVNNTNGYIVTDKEILETLDAGVSWHIKQNFNAGKAIGFRGDYGYAVSTDYGIVRKTINAGATWTPVITGSTQSYNSVCMPEDNVVILATSSQLVKSIDNGVTWTIQPVSGGTITKAFFFNALNGFVATANGKIMKTSDGGVTWSTKYDKSNITPSEFFTIYFYDTNIGYATHAHNTMLKTVNGGETWTELTDSIEAIYDIQFLTASTGYACGDLGVIEKTINGGLTWTPASWTTAPLGDSQMNALYFTDENTGYSVGARGRIVRTENGGANWTAQAPTYNKVNQIDFYSPSVGYALVGNTFYKSIDNGATWVNFGAPSANAKTTEFDLIDNNLIYAIGGGSVSSSGDTKSVYKSVNGGQTWTTLPDVSSIFHDDLYCLDFVDSNIGYVSGGYNSHKTFKTINGGQTWTILNSMTFYKLKFFSELIGYGRTYSAMYKTIDGGVTWTLSYQAPDSITDFDFTDVDHGYFVGDDAMMYKTLDAGATWVELDPPYEYYDVVDFITPQYGYIANDDGVLFRTQDGGETWTSVLSVYIITDISFAGPQVYVSGEFGKILRAQTGVLDTPQFSEQGKLTIWPNPVSTAITIHSNEQLTALKLTDLSGRLVMERTALNTNDIIVNIDIPCGLYILKATATDGAIFTQKVIVK